MKAWLTKWALDKTWGVVTCEADGHSVSFKHPQSGDTISGLFFEPNEYSSTREDAIAKVELMRQRRLASLRKQIADLETRKIKVPE